MIEDIPEFNEVLYLIEDNCCFFSGIGTENRTSTINAAESIIQSIADQENVHIQTFRWFDLQTHLGYDKASGDYEMDELLVEIDRERPEGFTVTQWKHTECPPDVSEAFKDQIGKSEFPILSAEEASKLGFRSEGKDSRLENCIRTLKLESELFTYWDYVIIENKTKKVPDRFSVGKTRSHPH
jgi:hypothetical protein